MKNIKKKFIPLTLLLIGSMILSVIPINEISLASPGIVTIREVAPQPEVPTPEPAPTGEAAAMSTSGL
jgi:hypothetical protein